MKTAKVPEGFWAAAKRGAGLAFGAFLVGEAIEIIKSPIKRKKLKKAGESIRDVFTNKKTEEP
jgi:hypothetical protein